MIVVSDASPLIALPAVRPVLDALAIEAGFHTGDVLYRRVLEAAGE